MKTTPNRRGRRRRLVDEQRKQESVAMAEGSAGDNVGSSLAGRRANWNLGAYGVGPSLFWTSACRTVRSGLPVGCGIGEQRSRDWR